MDQTWFDSTLFQWVVLPLLIFLARVLDVSFGTIRIIFVSKGQKFLAPLLGFVEILIWLMAITQVMNNLSNVLAYIAYAGGFAMGNFVGISIEERLAMGLVIVHIITTKSSDTLFNRLTQAGFGATKVEASGARGPATLIYSVIRRKDLPQVLEIIHEVSPKAFYSIEDSRSAREGIFPTPTTRSTKIRSQLLRLRKQ
ncbi:MAG: DUF2179 domain-containing protein [Firmicutes bacterium]|nr:DUF2179 domain-containing protein [Bacillota bacterium]